MPEPYRSIPVRLPSKRKKSDTVMIISTVDDAAKPRENSHYKGACKRNNSIYKDRLGKVAGNRGDRRISREDVLENEP